MAYIPSPFINRLLMPEPLCHSGQGKVSKETKVHEAGVVVHPIQCVFFSVQQQLHLCVGRGVSIITIVVWHLKENVRRDR